MDDAVQQALLQEFIAESGDALQQIESGLLQLESRSGDVHLINTVFRSMHTVKGNCLMLGFSRLETLTHGAENLLENLRNHNVACSSHILSLLLRVVDEVRSALTYIGHHTTEPDINTSVLQQQLAAACAPSAPLDSEANLSTQRKSPRLEDRPTNNQSDVLSDAEEEAADPGAGADVLDEGFIRLPVKKLDEFLDMLASINAELGYWRTRIPAEASGGQNEAYAGLDDVGQQMTYLQDAILRYRLEPIGRIWRPYQRLVRDLALSTGKRVLLVTKGEETEVDRSVLMTIKDPLGHLLRNAIVHGIETPEVRQKKGKTPVGRVELSARQEYGQISVSVRDDGAGLDVDRIRATAAAHQVVMPAQLEALTDNDIAQLIFAPGVSTSTRIDNISGRGTGLDVVKSAVTAVGGSVQVHSDAGQGSCFELHIPQSMAMVSTLLVRVQRSVLALPQAQVVEVVGLDAADAKRYLTTNMGNPAFVFRDTCVPLYQLQEIVTPDASSMLWVRTHDHGTDINVVVVQHAQRRLALQVDEVVEVADMVIKPLHCYLRHIPILSGGAVLADGKVAFVLDIGGIITWVDGSG